MDLATLPIQIEARRGGAKPDVRDGRIVLTGGVQWCFRGQEPLLTELDQALGRVSERLGPELLLVDFGNSVGLLALPPPLGTVEVVSGKWDRTHFDGMLQELMAIASALPFTADAATALPYDRSVAARGDVLYHAFVYLRHVLSEEAPRAEQLLPALRLLLRDPHRRFERTSRSVPLETATRVDVRGLVSALAGRSPLYRAGSHRAAGIPLATALRGHLPERLEQSEVRSTYDTAENRFVKSFLQLALGTVEGMRRAVTGRGDTAFAQRILAECAAMERALLPIQRNALWEEVGPMVHLPAASTVLQRRAGYREVFHHFTRMRLASRVPLDAQTVWKLLEVKDIATLYELWCFFRVARELEALLGPPLHAEGVRADALQVSVPWEFHLRWKNGTRLFYNPRFSRSAGALRRSYSVPLRPDIGLQLPNHDFHLFDAKFRLERLDAVFATADPPSDGEVEAERRGTFKRDDLYKMHTYRDAIPGARSVWILYPGTELRFYRSDCSLVHSPEEFGSSDLEGVGAVPLLPGGDAAVGLRTVLQRLLANSPPDGS